MEYMPEYSAKLQPDKDYLHVVLSTLYPSQTFDMVQTAYKKRSISNQTPKDHMIEMTPEVHKLINQLIDVKSKHLSSQSVLASHGRAADLLKLKSKFSKSRSKQKVYKAEIGDIMKALPYQETEQKENDNHQDEESKEELKEEEIHYQDDMR